ncbi:MAG: energy transducer TonB [Deltaproteobacteria bacterium]|nr:energy transducer TonB [Deltaproteobacteria bacterium]
MRTHAAKPIVLAAVLAGCAAQPAAEPAAPEPVVIDVSAEGDAAPGKQGAEGKLQRDREIARNAGILAVLEGQDLSGIFGSSGLGADQDSALGGLIGNEVGEAYGLGGLGLKGTGRGGGGTGEGTIGLGKIGIIGHGGGGGSGFGSGHGRLGGSRKQLPRVRMGGVTTGGGLDKNIIRRVVRSHYGALRVCYEQRLVKDPNLAGRVVVDFGIGKDGTVSGVKAAESTGDPKLDSCVVKVFAGMAFPKPQGGSVVQVKYPIVFSAGGSKKAPPKPAPSKSPAGAP